MVCSLKVCVVCSPLRNPTLRTCVAQGRTVSWSGLFYLVADANSAPVVAASRPSVVATHAHVATAPTAPVAAAPAARVAAAPRARVAAATACPVTSRPFEARQEALRKRKLAARRPIRPGKRKHVNTTIYMDCKLCFDKSGTKTPVTVKYMRRHLAKYHQGNKHDPDGQQVKGMIVFPKERRLASKRRKLEAEADEGVHCLLAHAFRHCVG